MTSADGARFAVYFVPAPQTPLYRFGISVLGYDCYSGEPVERSRDIGLAETDWAALTAEPRTYGFHATLKAPFRLRGDSSPDDLLKAMQAFTASVPEAPTLAPTVELIGGFVAIVPQGSATALERLAADCVTAFERFRAPLTAEERQRRLAAGLSARLLQNLERWGYPYVLEEFRFHMTLTGSIAAERRAAIRACLRDAFARACGAAPIVVDRLALVCQEGRNTPFRVIGQAPIGH
jgi:putative phosphonate metabolism protein